MDELIEKLRILNSDTELMQGSKIPTLTEVFEYFMKYYKSDTIKTSTAAGYYSRYYNHVAPTLGDLPITKITTAMLQKLFITKLNNGLKFSFVNKLLYEVRVVFDLAVNNAIIDKNPCDGVFIKRVKQNYHANGNEEAHRFVEKWERDHLLELLRGTPYFLPVKVAMYTGMRAGEICALKRSDLDFDTGVIRVNHTLCKVYCIQTGEYEYNLTSPKTMASIREIPIHRNLIADLMVCKGHPATVWIGECESKLEMCRVDDFLFSSKEAPLMIATYLDKAIWNRQMAEYKVKVRESFVKGTETPEKPVPIRMHDLRATFATLLFQDVGDIKAVQKILGHTDANTTLNMYLKTHHEAKTDLINKLKI